MRKSTIGLLALVLAGAPLAGMHPSSAAPAACFVRPATLETSADEIVGSGAADVVVTGAGQTFVYGYGGRDRICGSTGHDSIWGGPGNDLVTAGGGWDVVDGGDGLSVLPSGDDTLYGGPGRDTVTGRDGADRLYGGPGNDTLEGDADPHAFVAPGAGARGGFSAGYRTVNGLAEPDRLRGGTGDDLLRGGPGHDSLFGGPGEDILIGGDGRDVLIGGPGHDALFGGPGYDMCFVGEGTDSVRSCELIRVHQPRLVLPRLGLPGDYVGAPPRIVQVTDLGAATRQLASRVRVGRCWCTTQPARTLAGRQIAATTEPTRAWPSQLAHTTTGRATDGGCGCTTGPPPILSAV
jgi:Ca2+-binding RTX toxin-like protein